MGSQDDSRTGLIYLPHHLPEVDTGMGIKSCCRFVQEDNSGVVNEGGRN